MEPIGKKIEKNPKQAMGLLALFFLSPISPAQLFEAAGIIKRIALNPLLIAFTGDHPWQCEVERESQLIVI